jgi:WD40 repeat protein
MLTETIKAHSGALWSIHVRPDQRALVTGSADRDVKFWEFEFKDTPEVNSSNKSTADELNLVRILDSEWKNPLPSSCEDVEDVRRSSSRQV